MKITVKPIVPSTTQTGFNAISSEEIMLPGGVKIIPIDNNTPVLQAVFPSIRESDVVSFILTGKIPVPCFGRVEWVMITGTIHCVYQADATFSITGSSAESSLPALELADNVHLLNGCLKLSGCRYQTDVTLHGTVTFTEDGIAAEGKISAPIKYHPENQEIGVINTLLTEAAVSLENSIRLRDGTIRFRLGSIPGSINTEEESFSEDDELLYQFDEPFSLKSMEISGIPPDPVTMGVELVPSHPSFLLLTIFPARLNSNYFGEATALFLHGTRYNDPFIIKTPERWNASVSSNVYLQLMAPHDESGDPLLEATAALTGEILGDGLEIDSLTLHAETTSAILFPKSRWPQPMPDQNINLTIEKDGSIRLSLTLESLSFNGVTIRNIEPNSARIHASVQPDGLVVSGNLQYAAENGEITENISTAVIRGDCGIIMKH